MHAMDSYLPTQKLCGEARKRWQESIRYMPRCARARPLETKFVVLGMMKGTLPGEAHVHSKVVEAFNSRNLESPRSNDVSQRLLLQLFSRNSSVSRLSLLFLKFVLTRSKSWSQLDCPGDLYRSDRAWWGRYGPAYEGQGIGYNAHMKVACLELAVPTYGDA